MPASLHSSQSSSMHSISLADALCLQMSPACCVGPLQSVPTHKHVPVQQADICAAPMLSGTWTVISASPDAVCLTWQLTRGDECLQPGRRSICLQLDLHNAVGEAGGLSNGRLGSWPSAKQQHHLITCQHALPHIAS